MKMSPELKALESEIFPQRPHKRVHIRELQAAWAAWCREQDLTPVERFIRWFKRKWF